MHTALGEHIVDAKLIFPCLLRWDSQQALFHDGLSYIKTDLIHQNIDC